MKENLLKLSIFNSIIPLKFDKLLIYNAKEDNIIITHSSYKNAIENTNISHLKSELPDPLYTEMVNNKFIIDKAVNEGNELKEHRRQLYEDDNKYTLVINPTLDCNLNCWYCYETRVKSRMSDLDVNATKTFIHDTIIRNPTLKKFELSFFGGEPLIYYNKIIQPLITETAAICEQNDVQPIFGFTTNGTLFTDHMIEKLCKHRIGFQITLDGSEQSHNNTRFRKNGKGTYHDIITNIKKLSLIDNFHITMRFNCTNDNIDSIPDVLNEFEDRSLVNPKNITVAFQQVWQDFKKGDLTNKISVIKNRFQEADFYIDELDELRAPRWCDGNRKNSAIINYNGEVFKCTARDFKSETKEGQLSPEGGIVWNSDKVNKRYDALFSSDLCYDCRIAPICTERCSQKNLEDNKARCIFSEKQKDEKVLSKFYHIINTQKDFQ